MRKSGTPHGSTFAYQRVAGSLLSLIQTGTLRVGERLPSIRHVCRSQRVSPATALQAFAELEREGYVEVRDRSGHYVLPKRGEPPQPAMRFPDPEPTKVGVSDEVEQVFNAVGDSRLTSLGAAIPSPDLLPGSDLARHLAAAARNRPDLITRYSFAAGQPDLCRELAKRYAGAGCVIPPDEFTITAGAMEALNLAIRAVTRPGDIVAVESPGYFGLLEILESLGLKALPIPCTCDRGIDMEALQAALEDHPVKALVCVPSFSNPTGACLSAERRAQLAALLADYGVPLVEDDIYGELYFGPEAPRPVRAWDTRGNVLLCGSFSKSLTPGLRVGWVAGGRFTERIRRLKHITSVNTPEAIQAGVARYLAAHAYDRHLRRLRRSFQQQVWTMRQAVLRDFPEGTVASDPQGGCFLWIQLPDRVDGQALYRLALENGVGIAPGRLFCPAGDYRNFIRLGCGMPWTPRIAGAVATLGRLVRQLGRKNLRVS